MRRAEAVLLVMVLAAAAARVAQAQAQSPSPATHFAPGAVVEIAAAVALAGVALILLLKGGQVAAQLLGIGGKGGGAAGPGGAAGQASSQARSDGKTEQGNIALNLAIGGAQGAAGDRKPDGPAQAFVPGSCGFAQLEFHRFLEGQNAEWRSSLDGNTGALRELTEYLKGRDQVDQEIERRVREALRQRDGKPGT